MVPRTMHRKPASRGFFFARTTRFRNRTFDAVFPEIPAYFDPGHHPASVTGQHSTVQSVRAHLAPQPGGSA